MDQLARGSDAPRMRIWIRRVDGSSAVAAKPSSRGAVLCGGGGIPFSDFREIAYDRMGQTFHLGPWLGETLLRPVVETAFLRAEQKYGLRMERVSPEQALAQSQIPLLLIHGADDQNIPPRHSERILHARPRNTEIWRVANADHCGAISTAPAEFASRLLHFYAAHSKADFHAFVPRR